MSKIMFVVNKVKPFEIEESPKNIIHLPFPITFEAGKMIGYLPVYATAEDALSDFPDAELTMIQNKLQGKPIGGE